MNRRRLVRIAAIFLMIAAGGCGQGDQEGLIGPTSPRGVSPEVAPPAAASQGEAPRESVPPLAEPTRLGEAATTPSGLKYETLKEGDGPQAKPGDRVTVHYTGTFEDGRVFDSSRERGEPWTFELGSRQAVAGFNEGVAGMKVGERRRLIVAPQIGYGALGTFAQAAPGVPEDRSGAMQTGRRPEVPPNTTLIFEVELLQLP